MGTKGILHLNKPDNRKNIPRRVPAKYPIKSYLEKLKKNHSDTQIFTKAGKNVSITAILYCFSITHTLYIFLLFTV
jgi:hypothetical protein